MVYSYEELKSVKYTELLKISKSLQLKGVRQKAEKLIQLILRQQKDLQEEEVKDSDENDGPIEMLEDIVFPETSLLSDEELGNSPELMRKNDRQCVSTEVTVTKKRSFNSLDEAPLLNIRVKRSDTFVVDNNESEKNSNSLVGNEPLVTSTSSKTKDTGMSQKFTRLRIPDLESACKKRRLSNARVIPIIKKPDLTCSEVLTAANIKDVEESPLNPAFNLTDNRSNRIARRSMRGLLLNSRLTERISSFNAIPAPVIRERSRRYSNQDPKSPTDKKLSNISSAQREVHHSTKLNTPNIEKDKKRMDVSVKSGIPRFVTYARKLNIPNFSRIHEKNFQQMEGVDDYLERKQFRARNAQRSFCLTSSKKTKSVFKPTVTLTKDMNLNFNDRFKPTTSPIKSALKKSVSKPNTVRNTNSMAFKQKKSVKENVIPAKTRLNFSKAVTDVPFKGSRVTDRGDLKRAPVSRISNLKVAVRKGPTIVSSTERRARQSNFLKGVRLNKRFELQMAKRGLKLN